MINQNEQILHKIQNPTPLVPLVPLIVVVHDQHPDPVLLLLFMSVHIEELTEKVQDVEFKFRNKLFEKQPADAGKQYSQ